MVLSFVQRMYAIFFARKIFYKFNKLLYSLSLRGLGILNYETDVISGEECFINEYVSKVENGVILDVGANVGNYSKKIRDVNPKIPIYAFEPHPKTFLKLQENVKELNVTIFNAGVGTSDGVLSLYDYADNDGSEHASLYQDVIEKIHQGRVVAHEVEIVTLGAFAARFNIGRVNLLKIDTEGHELEVLKGFESHIRQNKVDLIHFEFNKLNVVSRIFFKDFWEFLPNYEFYRMVQDGLVPIKNYDPVYCEIFAYQNILAKLKVLK